MSLQSQLFEPHVVRSIMISFAERTRPRVLVCDDNVLLVDLIEHHLGERGFEVEFAHDGGEALEMIFANPPDAIVLDAMMPVCSGFEVLRRIKEDPKVAGVPVIMLTGLVNESDVLNALKLGAAEFMVKPFIPEELAVRLARLLDVEALASA